VWKDVQDADGDASLLTPLLLEYLSEGCNALHASGLQLDLMVVEMFYDIQGIFGRRR
jgi:hypothetical protein